MSLISYLITMFAVLFWMFRVVIAVTTSLNVDIGLTPIDLTAEIVMLFVALFCLILIFRRQILGAILYIVSYGWYFGKDILNAVIQVQNGTQLSAMEILNVFIAFIAIILALAILVDITISKTRKGMSTKNNKKTDWFYKNEQFDREFDERADRNNYKF